MPRSPRSAASDRKKKSMGSPPRLLQREEVQHAAEDGDVAVGRDHVDAPGLDLHPILHLHDGHLAGALQQLDEDGLVGRVEVLDHDERHVAALGHVAQELLERLQPSGRRADPDDGKRRRLRGLGERGAPGRRRCRFLRPSPLADPARLPQRRSTVAVPPGPAILPGALASRWLAVPHEKPRAGCVDVELGAVSRKC